jgi:hypothetical protein
MISLNFLFLNLKKKNIITKLLLEQTPILVPVINLWWLLFILT